MRFKSTKKLRSMGNVCLSFTWIQLDNIPSAELTCFLTVGLDPRVITAVTCPVYTVGMVIHTLYYIQKFILSPLDYHYSHFEITDGVFNVTGS